MTNINFDEPSVGDVTADFKAAISVRNKGNQGDAVLGEVLGTKGVGVVGRSAGWMAIFGGSETHQGIHGNVKVSGFGVVGTSDGDKGSGACIWGAGNKTIGVLGESTLDIGVHGKSQEEIGVFGQSEKRAGVLGQCNNGSTFGVQGHSIPTGIGAILAVGGKHALVATGGTQSAGRFEGNVEVTGDIKLVNGDCAEDFDVADSELKSVEAGTVMVLTENGSLQPSYQEYDKKVAGIVSGASGYKPAIVLDSQGTQDRSKNTKNRLPIALMGKVYCKVDARNSSIEMGDLLTTSSTNGYAMKAEDPMKAFGAVIGKALGSIKEGLGMIPVLVALQ